MAEIVLVAIEGEGVIAVANLLRGAGYVVVTALGFKEATALVAAGSPDLLVSAIRLGGYNGLHLVLRSRVRHPALRAILLDRSHDRVMESEAKRYGAEYLVEPIDGDALLAQISLSLSTEVSTARRWPRKKAADGMCAEVERRAGRVIDLSYGGLRFELPRTSDVPELFDVSLPGTGLVFQAKPVWVRRMQPGWLSCGVELLNPHPQAADSWRRLVDALPDRPS
jgi:DNA-binding response OmpR family regulator